MDSLNWLYLILIIDILSVLDIIWSISFVFVAKVTSFHFVSVNHGIKIGLDLSAAESNPSNRNDNAALQI